MHLSRFCFVKSAALRRKLLGALLVLMAGSASAQHAVNEKAADQNAQLLLGKTLFTQGANNAPACAICHTLKDAEATGEIGPPLDEIKPNQARVFNAVKNGVNNMPAFSAAFTDEQIRAVARYVEQATQPAAPAKK